MSKLNEEHVIAFFPGASFDWDRLGISDYLLAHSAGISCKFKDYQGDDNVSALTMHRRAGLVNTLLSKWLCRVGQST